MGTGYRTAHALPEKFRAEKDIVAVVLFADSRRVSDRDSRLDDHRSLCVTLQHKLNDCLHRGGIEKVLVAVIVRRCGDHNELRIAVCKLCVSCRGQIQRLVRKIIFNLRIHDRRLLLIDQLHLFRNDVHCVDLVMLC